MPDTWPSVGRIIHFAGGLRGENPPNDSNVYILPTLPTHEPVVEILDSYGAITQLAHYGLIIGCDFYRRPEEVHGVYPPEWRQYTYNKGVWLGFEVSQKMAEIRHAAYCQEKYDFVERLSKVEAWTKAASRALRSISESYHLALAARCREEDFKTPQAFDDMNCDYINDSLHNFLYYAGTLRDHIAELIVFHIAQDVPSRLKKKPTMANLKKLIEENDHGLGDIKRGITAGYDQLAQAEVIPGWLYMLATYRNIITHEKPIGMIVGRSCPWTLVHSVGDRLVPNLKFPIPYLPLGDTDYFQNVPEKIKEKVKNVAPSEVFMAKNPDGLEVAWRLLLQLLLFLGVVLESSPIKAKPIVVNSSNSWGFKRIK